MPRRTPWLVFRERPFATTAPEERDVSLSVASQQVDGREMRGKVDKVERVTSAVRDALMAYQNLDGPDAALVIVALFGVTHSKRVAPLLEDLARSVQPAQKTQR